MQPGHQSHIYLIMTKNKSYLSIYILHYSILRKLQMILKNNLIAQKTYNTNNLLKANT